MTCQWNIYMSHSISLWEMVLNLINVCFLFKSAVLTQNSPREVSIFSTIEFFIQSSGVCLFFKSGVSCTFVSMTGQGWSVGWSTATACQISLSTPNSSHIHLISTGKHPASPSMDYNIMNMDTAWHLFFFFFPVVAGLYSIKPLL